MKKKCEFCGNMFETKSATKRYCNEYCRQRGASVYTKRSMGAIDGIMKDIQRRMVNGEEFRKCVNCGKWFKPLLVTLRADGTTNVCGEYTCSYHCTQELICKGAV